MSRSRWNKGKEHIRIQFQRFQGGEFEDTIGVGPNSVIMPDFFPSDIFFRENSNMQD